MGSAARAAIAAAGDLVLTGATGRGDDLAAALAQDGAEVLVEFTAPSAVEAHLSLALEAGVDAVSGTTGLDEAALLRIDALARARGRAALVAPNFALGVLLLQRFAVEAARWFRDVEIVELHHERKLDAPSGTARDTARRIAAAAAGPLNRDRPAERVDLPGARGGDERGVPIHAIRLPGLLAHQEVLFGAPGELLTLRHDTSDRQAFMPGVLLAVRRLRGRSGLLRSLHELLELEGD
jgi:4-hydroxy-tetrahydrodipicolinate reductase